MSASTAPVRVTPEWTFADRLRKARVTAGKTQREFAELLGVVSGSYAQWEAGNNKPRDIVAVARRIELLTLIPSAWMLGVDEPPRPEPGDDVVVRREGIEPPTR